MGLLGHTLSCYLDMLNKLEKWVRRTVAPKLAASLKPWVIVKHWPSQIFSVVNSLVDIHLN